MMVQHQAATRRYHLMTLINVMMILVLLSLVVASLSSSAPPSFRAQPHRPSNKNKHTRLTGFGSRSVTKSIFAKEHTAPFQNNNNNSTLWVRQDEKDSLWLQSRSLQNKTTICVSLSSDGSMNANVCDSHAEKHPKKKKKKKQKWIPVEGLYGVFRVPSGVVWVLITSSQETYTARIHEKHILWQIRKVQSLELVHLPTQDPITSQRQIKEEMRQLGLLRQALRQHDFYYVVSSQSSLQPPIVTDMTQTLQRALDLTLNETDTTFPWWNTAATGRPDSRFFWNEPAVEPLLSQDPSLLRHVIPVTSAFVGVQTNVSLDDNSTCYDEVLISRRSRFRAGTRFTKRGADGTGAVANYAETEQLCFLYKKKLQSITSHVQTRGSIPLRWSSPADVKTYRPRVRIGTDPLAQARAVRSHVLEQWSLYASHNNNNKTKNEPKKEQLVFVNLIDKNGDQGRLGRAFGAVLQAVLDVYAAIGTCEEDENDVDETTSEDTAAGDPQRWTIPPNMIRHMWFDFHAECKGGRWDRLKNLLKDVSPTLEEQGYLCAIPPNHHSTSWKVVQRQHGVVRTNCMDCLDRTNVVQSIFGRHMLFRQLYEEPGLTSADGESKASSKRRNLPLEYASSFRQNPLSLPWSSGEVSHRLLWADNADAISRLYAGTPALKGDFTRTGKRTKRGALDDGMNSLQRYYLNNFLDADRQEGMDLLVGYADFAIVGDDALDTVEADDVAKVKSTMSIQEAARAMLLGRTTTDVGDDDERYYERIKHRPQRRLQQNNRIGVTVSLDDGRRRPLGLRWLPGDLQSHMRSRAAALGDHATLGSPLNYSFSTASALEAIDRRAASDEPWWVTTIDSSDDERVVSKETLGSSSTNAGHLVGGLVASIQLPVVTAAVVVCMMFPSVWPRKEENRTRDAD